MSSITGAYGSHFPHSGHFWSLCCLPWARQRSAGKAAAVTCAQVPHSLAGLRSDFHLLAPVSLTPHVFLLSTFSPSPFHCTDDFVLRTFAPTSPAGAGHHLPQPPPCPSLPLSLHRSSGSSLSVNSASVPVETNHGKSRSLHAAELTVLLLLRAISHRVQQPLEPSLVSRPCGHPHASHPQRHKWHLTVLLPLRTSKIKAP